MSKQERVVCAAIRRVGKGYLDRLSECIDICLQYDDEYSTANYHSERDVGIEFHEEVKGFITNKNRFVDPAEALRIALDSKQLEKDVIDRMIHECAITLKPEDLY